MKVSAVFALCFFGFALFTYGQIFTSQAPLFSSNLNYLNSTNFPITGVIGQATFTSGQSHDNVGANTLDEPGELKFVPYNNYTANFSAIIQLTPGTIGLLAVDYDNDRVLYYPNITSMNTPNAGATQVVATFVFGQSNQTDTSNSVLDVIRSVDFSNQGVYILSQNTIFFYKWTSVNLAYGGVVNPDSYFGNCGTCNYTQLSDSYDLAVKKSTGEVFVADYDCSRVLVFPGNAQPTTEPNYVIGMNDTTQCPDDDACSNSASPSTCLYGAYYLVFDSQDNLWVLTYSDESLYFFPNVAIGQRQLTAKFVATSNDIDSTFSDAQQISMGPTGDNQVMIISEDQSYIIQFNFPPGLGYPTSGSTVLAFGDVGTGTKAYTNALETLYGGAVLRNPSTGLGNTVFVSDYDNDRIVSFVLNATGGSANPSPSVSSSFSSTQSVSLSHGASPPMSMSMSLSMSMSPSAASQSMSNSFGASPTMSPTPYTIESSSTPSATPASEDFSYSYSFHIDGSASSMSSWLNLIF